MTHTFRHEDKRSGIVLTTSSASLSNLWTKITQEYEEQETAWIAKLREDGVKAAHPDDGWVNREENSVHFCYPQFCDGPKEGDVIALGSARSYRLVRVTERKLNRFAMERFYFEDIHG